MSDTTEEKSLTLASPLDVAKASTGMVLQEAVNLGEINPAMARRIGERIDQVFNALMRGAGASWNAKDGTINLVYPEVVNPILAAVKEKQRVRELRETTAIPESAQVLRERLADNG